VQAALEAARNGYARTNNAQRVGGGSTLRRCAALHSERPRSLRRALNMNAKYAGVSRTLRERAISERRSAHIYRALCSMPAWMPLEGARG
jgi:hypothetical protein